MRFTIITITIIAFFINTINCNDEQHAAGLDFGLDMLKSLSKDGVGGLVDLALKGQTGPGALLLKSVLSLLKNEPKEVQDKLKEHKKEHTDSKLASAPSVQPLSEKAIALLKKVEDIKKAGGKEEDQNKKIKDLVHDPSNKDAFAEITAFLKKVSE